MNTLRDFLSKDRMIPVYLGLILILGILLMSMGGRLFRGARRVAAVPEAELPAQVPVYITAPVIEPHPTSVYERALERRLESALSMVEGVGQVRVLVVFTQGRETVFAVDRNTNASTMQEVDSQGGTRYQSNQQAQDNTLIITDRTGVDRPLVVREIEPVIGGVMIIAEGGDNVLVRDALIRATSTLLDIDINRVQVMKMGDQSRREIDLQRGAEANQSDQRHQREEK